MRLGAYGDGGVTRFAVRAPDASALSLCLFDATRTETRYPMARSDDDAAVWTVAMPGDYAGAAYGYRAEGEWAPGRGHWFDPAKLLVDPYAVALDRRFGYDPRLSQYGADTAALVPRAIVPGSLPQAAPPPRLPPGALIYELNVKGFTHLHPDVPEGLRGTVAALAHPAIVAHLRKLHVDAVELMPVIAWIDERHLPPLGLSNFWGYNPLAPMALDPGLCPGGVAELRETVAALHAAGIAVILDIVLNHTGESDNAGPVVCLRGLDNAAYAHDAAGALINDTGCGNTLDFASPSVRALALDTLRHFAGHCGVAGFRFDLAPIMARGPGFDAHAPFFAEIAGDPLLASLAMIAEPWDIGPGGYQLGHFPAGWLEWNDRYRDDVRRYWRRNASEGFAPDDATAGTLATRLAGSADVFGEQACRSVNFLAAHDGFTLADLVAYEGRHNQANGEDNRDGHGENFSWNCGAEGASTDPAVLARRAEDARALLGTLFASTGACLLAAGDEFGRSQQGNNNAYCQDSAIGWIDWAGRDRALEDYVAGLAAWRAGRRARFAQFPRAGVWQRLDGGAMAPDDWNAADGPGFAYRSADAERAYGFRIEREARRVTLNECDEK